MSTFEAATITSVALVWVVCGISAWIETVKEFGFKWSDLWALPFAMIAGPFGLAINRGMR